MKFNLRANWKQKHFLIALLLLNVGFIQAQKSAIKGKVSDADGPLPGVSVLIKGTSNGTVTDFDGVYEISASPDDIIVYTYVGYKTSELVVSNSASYEVILTPEVSALEEVVVIGYGTQKKKEVTGAVVKISSDVIDVAPVADIGVALQGQVAGVNVQQTSGRPGDAANVQIRGLGSLNADGLGPLYVVDGVPYEGNPNISPDQIQSIDILKDGASSAIYGTRGSNGVILITTKRGEEGKMKINFNTYTGIQNITSGTPLMNTDQQMYIEDVTLAALGRTPTTFIITPNALDYDTDFVGDVQNNNAEISNYNLQISGGTKNLTLNLNTNYFKQEGVLINSGFDRLANRLTGEFKKGKLKVFTTVGFTTENRTQEPWALYEQAIVQRPWRAPLNSLESNGDNGVVLPPDNEIQYSYLSSQLGNSDKRVSKSLNFAFNAEYELFKGFTYKINLGSNSWENRRTFYQPQYLAYSNDGELNAGASRLNAKLEEDYIWSNRQTIENIFNYKTSFGKNNLQFLGVISYEEYKYRELGVGAIFSETTSNDLRTFTSSSEGIKPNSLDRTTTLSGKLFRVLYNYDGKYLFSASIRRDGSSNFSEENRYGTFPGVSAGWNIHNEEFFKSNVVNSLKLRASYAGVGNQTVKPYSTTPIIEAGINYPFGASEEIEYGTVQRRYVDSNLKWETTISRNIGVDLGLFNNKLNITADYYYNDKEDMLLEKRISPSTGTYHPRASGVYDVVTVNAGNMYNKGIELAVNYNDETSYGLKYGIIGTFTQNKNEVTNLDGVSRGYGNGRPVTSMGTNVDYTTFLAEGYEAGAFFLVQHDGIIKTQEQLDAYKAIDGSAQLGDMMYKDIDGNNQIDDNDRVYSGSGQAKFEAGLTFNLAYKGFDLTVQSYYSHGAKIYNGAKMFAYANARHTDIYHMWSPQNADSDIATARQNAYHNNVRARSDLFLEDGTYFRLRNATIGYTVPKMKERAGIDKLRVYVTSLNPLTVTNYKGYDPEVGGDGIFTRGVDRGNYPVSRRFMLGVQLGF
ncbi:SusC/RagA family TonB-linked outer membrane protein [Flavicella marina]|uniref:SusC/RagA family TonB-linked outer membrane protein n=1 Tax=Flavicella marina TaxID=1475951 RepID=UPI00126463D2|nr:TonB-dependent receptor [Flavicella marina]